MHQGDTMESYMENSYIRDFDAMIIEIIDGKFVVLNKTYFYPNSGGQANDTGEMVDGYNAFKVINVSKRDGKVVHELDKLGIKGEKVHCIIDWGRRYAHMKAHTAMHILCECFSREANVLITGNQINVDKSRVDFNLEVMDRELIERCIKSANDTISKNLATKNYVITREEADKNPKLTKLAMGLPQTIKEVRIVEIGDFDMQADGGTHVLNTSEIGKIELISINNKGKNNRRLYFKLV